jgi:hypothetical protein
MLDSRNSVRIRSGGGCSQSHASHAASCRHSEQGVLDLGVVIIPLVVAETEKAARSLQDVPGTFRQQGDVGISRLWVRHGPDRAADTIHGVGTFDSEHRSPSVEP